MASPIAAMNLASFSRKRHRSSEPVVASGLKFSAFSSEQPIISVRSSKPSMQPAMEETIIKKAVDRAVTLRMHLPTPQTN